MSPQKQEIKDALAQMQRICSQGEKCTNDIEEKLIKKGLAEKDIHWVIDRLKEDKFIDDSRFTQFFVRDKLKLNKWGRIKISFALRNKKIPSEISEISIQSIDNEEYKEILTEEMTKKNRSLTESNMYKRKAKLYQFAAQRGFESELIYQVINELTNN
jgi:regulatory protein